jgi:hypothetical protein
MSLRSDAPGERRASARQATERRAIGSVGTIARALVGLAFIALAFLTGDFEWYSAPLGLLVAPAMLVLGQWLRLRFRPSKLVATGRLGFYLNMLIAVSLLVIPPTRAAAFLFYGASMLVAASRGYAGCESLAISNWLLRRDDQVGCVIFSPIDAAEARAKRSEAAA